MSNLDNAYYRDICTFARSELAALRAERDRLRVALEECAARDCASESRNGSECSEWYDTLPHWCAACVARKELAK